LCLLGIGDHACTLDHKKKFYLNKANTGHAFFSHLFEIEWKTGYDNGSCIPCVKIGDYYYEITYSRRFPQELKLLGRFIENDSWYSGRRIEDVEYRELIEIVFEVPFAPKAGEYYRAVKYTANYQERIFLYHSYSEHNGTKVGPYGATITNGEFAIDANLNDTSVIKDKYYIDGHRLISKYKKKQIVSLNGAIATLQKEKEQLEISIRAKIEEEKEFEALCMKSSLPIAPVDIDEFNEYFSYNLESIGVVNSDLPPGENLLRILIYDL
jgi:hypothetical protein